MPKFEYSRRAARRYLVERARLPGFGLIVVLLCAFAGGQGRGFYRVRDGGDAGLLAPDGRVLSLAGVAGMHALPPLGPDFAVILSNLQAAGWNALGADVEVGWWHHGLPHAFDLGLSAHLQADQQSYAFDVFDEQFPARLAALVQTATASRIEDHDLLGYFSDDGLSWTGDAGRDGELLRFYLQLPLAAAGRMRAADFLRTRYNGDVGALARAWGGTAAKKPRDFLDLQPPAGVANAAPAWRADAATFARHVLLLYLQACADALHGADPNHLFLGANLTAALDQAPDAAVAGIADVASLRVADTAGAAAVAGYLARMRVPVLVTVAGCAPTAALAAALAQPTVTGYFAEFPSPACALAPAWIELNRARGTGAYLGALLTQGR